MAARFVFKLKAVLELRERAERDRKIAVADLQRQMQQTIERAHAIQHDMVVTRHAIRTDLTPGASIPLNDVRMRATGSLSSMVELQRLALHAAGLQQKLAGARAELAQATMKRKAVEILREKGLAAFNAERNRREASEMDDLAIMRAGASGSLGDSAPGDGDEHEFKG